MNLLNLLKRKGKNKVENIDGYEIHTQQYSFSEGEVPRANITELSDKQLIGLREMQETASSFANDYLQREIDFLDSNILDEIVSKYKTDLNPKKDEFIDEENFIMLIGTAFGNIINENLNMEWCFYEDEYGKDQASKHKAEWIFAFPYSTVRKALMENKSLNDVELILKKQIEDSDSQ